MCRKRFAYPDDEDSDIESTGRGRRRRNVDFDDRGRCCRCCPGCCRGKNCRDRVQMLLVLLGVACGVGLGIYLRHVPPLDQPRLHPKIVMYVGFPGEILIRFMSMLCLPLIASSLISGLASLDAVTSLQMGGCALAYYIGTTTLAVMEGFAWIYAVRPGANVDLGEDLGDSLQGVAELRASGVDMLFDVLRNLFPDNFVTMAFWMTNTQPYFENITLAEENESSVTHVVENYRLGHIENMNILGIALVSILFGLALASVKESKPLVDVVNVFFRAIMKLLQAMMWLYPIGIASLIAERVVTLPNPLELIIGMGVFLGTVMAALACHVIIVLPLVYLMLARRNPFKLMMHCGKALLVALATSNSNITLPVTLDCLERKARVSRVCTRFICPLGATVNMDGFALYEAMAAVFVALLHGMNPGPVEMLTLGFAAIVISIGAPSVGNGVILFTMLFRSIGLPLEDIALLAMFDWFLGRLRTMTNVWGDCVGTGVIARLARNMLARAEAREAHARDVIYEEPNHNLPLPRGKGRSYTLTMRNENDDIMKVSRL